jgi:hypothetical protein
VSRGRVEIADAEDSSLIVRARRRAVMKSGHFMVLKLWGGEILGVLVWLFVVRSYLGLFLGFLSWWVV